MRFRFFTLILTCLLLGAYLNSEAQKGNILIDKGLAYLASTQSTSKGYEPGQGASIEPGVTPELSKAVGDWGGGGISALCLQAFLQNGHNIDDPVYGTTVTNGINYLLNKQTKTGYWAGRIGDWSEGYETAMAIVALKTALDIPLAAGGFISGALRTQIEDALALALNYYTQGINTGWTAVSWRYNRDYTSEYGGDMSVNQWVYLALDAMNYTDKNVWNKIYNYLNNVKCSSGDYSYVGYQSCGTRPQGNTCAGTWGAVLAGSYGVAAAPVLKDRFYNYLDNFSLSQLIDYWNIGDNQIYSGGGYYYYLYAFSKAMALGNKTIFAGGDYYLYLYNAIESQHYTNGAGNYYWDRWGGQGTNMETALALLCLQTGTVPPGSTIKISLEDIVKATSGIEDCIDFTIYDELGNAAGKNGEIWFTNIPNSEWLSTTGGLFELAVELEESSNFNVEIENTCLELEPMELCFKAFVLEELVDEECYEIQSNPGTTIGATAFVNAIGGLNVIIVNPPAVIPVMELEPSAVVFHPYQGLQTYNFTFDVKETGGETNLTDVDIFASNLTDQFGNLIPSTAFTLVPNNIPTVPAGGSVTVQGTLVTPDFAKDLPGLFSGVITAQTTDQAKAVQFEIGNPTMTVTPTAFNVSNAAGNGSFTIDFTGLTGVDWTLSSDAAWLTAAPEMGTGDATVNFNYLLNATLVERTGTITIDAPNALNPIATVVVTQEPSTSTADQIVDLPAGWLGISSYIIPENPALDVVMAGVDDYLQIMLGNPGVYWPSQNINTIGNWNTYVGYKVKMNQAASLEMFGIPAEPTVTFPAGIHYLPVLSSEAVDNSVLGDVGNALQYAFNIQAGTVYWPAGQLYTIQMLEPGVGYLIKLVSGATFDFSGKTATTGNVVIPPVVSPWNVISNTGNVHLISIAESAMSDLMPGDIIGVFDGTGSCTGLVEINKTNENTLLVVYGDDASTTDIDGMQAGEPMNFRLFRPSGSEEFTLNVTYNPELNAGTFESNGTSMITGLKVGSLSVGTDNTGSFMVYPNPSQGLFNVVANGNYQLTVVDTKGQIVYSQKGNNNTTLDLTLQGKGIYFVKFTTDSGSRVEKIAIK